MQSTLNDILRNPPPRESRFPQYFLTLTTGCKACGDELERAGATSPGDLQMPSGGLSATPLRGRVPAHWTVPVEGTGVGADAQQPVPDWGAGGGGEKLVRNSCSCQGVKKWKSEFRSQRKEKASGMAEWWEGSEKAHFCGRGRGQKKK